MTCQTTTQPPDPFRAGGRFLDYNTLCNVVTMLHAELGAVKQTQAADHARLDDLAAQVADLTAHQRAARPRAQERRA